MNLNHLIQEIPHCSVESVAKELRLPTVGIQYLDLSGQVMNRGKQCWSSLGPLLNRKNYMDYQED